jgi:hypothetical protein
MNMFFEDEREGGWFRQIPLRFDDGKFHLATRVEKGIRST